MPLGSKVKKVTHAPGKQAAEKTRGRKAEPHAAAELVVITGMSGSGKASALKAFEDKHTPIIAYSTAFNRFFTTNA